MLNRGNFDVSSCSFEFSDFLGRWKLVTNAKFQISISKITPAIPKKCRGMGVNSVEIITGISENFRHCILLSGQHASNSLYI